MKKEYNKEERGRGAIPPGFAAARSGARNMLKNSDWIWCGEASPDEYAEFRCRFTAKGTVTLEISCDTDYAAYLNGRLAAFGQYPDYEYCKFGDRVGIEADGGCELLLVVRYCGLNTSTYTVGRAGVRFRVLSGDTVLASSGPDTESRLSPYYIQHRRKPITGQLGVTVGYDAAAAETAWHKSVVVRKPDEVRLRPIKKTTLGEPVEAAVVERTENRALLDLGRETVGFLELSFTSGIEQKVKIGYGERLVNGAVPYRIGGRDFSLDYVARQGANAWLNPFLRLGCRYLEIFSEAPLTGLSVAVRPVEYPFVVQPYDFGARNPIYEMCVNTLKLCAHDHYEDCPWREQALYAMDARNQMLCGYYAFGEHSFARASLMLFALDRRGDGLLNICCPAGIDLTIPSFSLHYFTAVREYVEHAGDPDFADKIFSKLESVLSVFIGRMRGSLTPTFTGETYWNFYEWSDGLDGNLGQSEEERFDLPLNCLFSVALGHMGDLCRVTGRPDAYSALGKEVAAAVNARFFDESAGLFRDYAGGGFSELGNALAILCGAAGGRAPSVARRLAGLGGLNDPPLTPVTLSMKCFLYDALLKTGDYSEWILSDIDRVYGRMLAAGSTTAWETEKGGDDFDGAGSLCHGWSALPIYYFHKFGLNAAR